jgi:hypothetical protein
MFHFKVTFVGKGAIAFQEVSGLDTEHDVIEYRAGNSPEFSTVRMPGLKKHSDPDDTSIVEYSLSQKKLNNYHLCHK